MAYELPSLPYDYTALEPAISKSTLEFHHDKHHAGYVSKYNNAVEGTELDNKSIEEVIKAIAGDDSKTGLFNNAAQAWNHIKDSSTHGIPQWQSNRMRQVIIARWQETWTVVETRNKTKKSVRSY